MSVQRRDALATGLGAVRDRVGAACRRHGRLEEEVTLVVVTKFFPASDVRLLHDLGVRQIGESRHPEAREKRDQCSDLPLTWHFVGQLQANKAAAVGSYVDVVHSVDRERVLSPLSRGAHARGRPLDVLVQVSLDPDMATAQGRSGAPPGEVEALAEMVARAEGLRLRGVMAVAPRHLDPGPAFETLALVAARVRAVDPAASWISAGMSGDLEQAVEHGATHVRVGSAILGNRQGRR